MFCPKCGKEVFEGAGFCATCGSSVGATQQLQSTVSSQQVTDWDLLKVQLSSKVKTQAMIWLIIGLIQVLIYGPLLIYVALEIWWEYPIYGISVMAIGIANICFSIRNFEYSKTVLIKPVAVVEKYKPIGGLIWNLIYNVFLGGILGVFGSIYAFVLRGFVLRNEREFEEMDNTVKPPKLLKQCSERLKTQGVIYLLVGLIQALIGIGCFISYLDGFSYPSIKLFNNSGRIDSYAVSFIIGRGILASVLLVLGSINIIFAIRNFKYSNNVVKNLMEIAKKYQAIGSFVKKLICNMSFSVLIGIPTFILSDPVWDKAAFYVGNWDIGFRISAHNIFFFTLMGLIPLVYGIFLRNFFINGASELKEIENNLNLDK